MISGAVIGIATVSGVLVYTASADRLRASPAYAGWAWDHAVYFEFAAKGGARDAAGVVEELSTWPEVERAGSMAVFVPPLLLGDAAVPSSTIAFAVVDCASNRSKAARFFRAARARSFTASPSTTSPATVRPRANRCSRA